VSRDPDLLPSLSALGERLGDAAAREIEAERAARDRPRRRRRPLRPVLLGIVAALAGAGAVTATGVFTGSGEPVPGERQPTAGSGVLSDSAAADPGGGLPWALRVFVDDRGRECVQLGRLSDGALGVVESGRFRPFAGHPNGSCGDLRSDPLMNAVDRRAQPAARTIVYGLTRGEGNVRVSFGDRVKTVRPGALGAYVVVYPGILDLSEGTVSAVVDGRRITRTLGP
jgi:hypothetical protein